MELGDRRKAESEAIPPRGSDGAKAACFRASLPESFQRLLQQEFSLRAIEFHGHLGPYLVLGLKAGLYANQILGR